MNKERLEEMKEASCFACHVEILWKDPMCIHNNKSYCRNCYLQVLRKQNQRYKQALEELENSLKIVSEQRYQYFNTLQRYKKALEEIIKLPQTNRILYIRQIARKALAGDKDD